MYHHSHRLAIDYGHKRSLVLFPVSVLVGGGGELNAKSRMVRII